MASWSETEAAEPDAGRSHTFRLDIHEACTSGSTRSARKLVIETWHAGRGLERIER